MHTWWWPVRTAETCSNIKYNGNVTWYIFLVYLIPCITGRCFLSLTLTPFVWVTWNIFIMYDNTTYQSIKFVVLVFWWLDNIISKPGLQQHSFVYFWKTPYVFTVNCDVFRVLHQKYRRCKHNLCWINLWKKCSGVRQATDDNTIQRMRFACWITKATVTLSIFVGLLGVLNEVSSRTVLTCSSIKHTGWFDCLILKTKALSFFDTSVLVYPATASNSSRLCYSAIPLREP